MNDIDIENTFNWAFATLAVKRIVSKGHTKIIHLDEPLAPRYLWAEFYEALEEHGSVWISSKKREYNDEGTFLYSVTPEKGYWKVCHAIKPNNTIGWCKIMQQFVLPRKSVIGTAF
jgi:hypothetical protein